MRVEDTCIACGACQAVCEDIIIEEKAILPEGIDDDNLIAICPMGAIVKE